MNLNYLIAEKVQDTIADATAGIAEFGSHKITIEVETDELGWVSLPKVSII